MRLPGPPTPEPGPWDAGIKLLDDGGARALLLARLGTIPWLLLTLGFTFALAGGWQQLRAAFVATALVATYPPLLGHAGLATTDVAAVATVLGFLLAFDRWADRPSLWRAAVVGAALALASLCKLTAPLLCAVLAAAWLAGRRMASGRWLGDGVRRPARELVAQAALAAVATLVVVWAGYRFSVGRLEDLPPMDYMGTPALAAARPARRAAGVAGAAAAARARVLARLPVPARARRPRPPRLPVRRDARARLPQLLPGRPGAEVAAAVPGAGDGRREHDLRPRRPPRPGRRAASAPRWRPSRRWRSRRSSP